MQFIDVHEYLCMCVRVVLLAITIIPRQHYISYCATEY